MGLGHTPPMLARWIEPDQETTECSDLDSDVNKVNRTRKHEKNAYRDYHEIAGPRPCEKPQREQP